MSYIPNALSFSRIPIGGALLVSAYTEAWLVAWVLLIIGSLTDAFDGYLAKRWDCRSRSGKAIDPIGDLFLSGGALLGLVFTGVWPLRVLVMISILSVILQLIEWFGPEKLQRHQMYMSPLLFVVLLGFLIKEYALMALQPSGWETIAINASLLAIFMVVIYLKKSRIREWFPQLSTH